VLRQRARSGRGQHDGPRRRRIAEIRIPFKTIPFRPGLSVWGINVELVIPRKLETVRLSGTNRDSNFNNPMEAALAGIHHVRQGKGITFRPYGLASTQTGFSGKTGREYGLDGGFDLYKNFTPNLVGVFSCNMDFAETEVDERRINLTRFPLFFPEKPMFFLEGSETFSFSSSVSFIPFFSRRIGLYGGEPVPVRFGAKLNGKIGNTNWMSRPKISPALPARTSSPSGWLIKGRPLPFPEPRADELSPVRRHLEKAGLERPAAMAGHARKRYLRRLQQKMGATL